MEKPHPSFKRTCLCKPLPIPQTRPTSDKIASICKELRLDNNDLKKYIDLLTADLKKGLGKATHDKAIVKCFITYVQDLPDGSETGRFLALDLGGTNFRVLLIELTKNHFSMLSKIYAVPQEIMAGSGNQLFDHIAECLSQFIKEENLEGQELPLGFTFSFPLMQKGLTKGILERWTKGFNCSGTIGQDVVGLLTDALKRRRDVNISVMAILNDTTGTLMSCAWKNRFCKIGLIVGTGTNACYVEKQKNVEMFDEKDLGSGRVLINTEWGAFGDDGSLDYLRTDYDREVDKNTVNPGKQLHEKMISGMYMGELVRLVLVRLAKEGLIFGGKTSGKLETRDAFETKFVSEIEDDPQGAFDNCKAIMEEMDLSEATDDDCTNVRYVCECVSRRAAHLASAGIVTLLHKMDEKRVTVGIDGSLYRFHPHFHNLMMEKIYQLVKPGIVVDLMLSEDGSGRGAALVAAVAARTK